MFSKTLMRARVEMKGSFHNGRRSTQMQCIMINIEKLCQVIYTLENSGVTFKARKYFPNKRGAIDGTYLCVIVIIVVSCDGMWRVARPFALLRCGHGRGGRPAAPGLRGSSPDSFTHCERAFCSVYHLREQLLIPTGLLVAMRLRVSGSYQTVPAHFWVIFSVRQLQMSLATCLRGPGPSADFWNASSL